MTNKTLSAEKGSFTVTGKDAKLNRDNPANKSHSGLNAMGLDLIATQSSLIGTQGDVSTLQGQMSVAQEDISNTSAAITNVDNTSDVNKPVSIAQQAAIDLKLTIPTATIIPPGTTGNQVINQVAGRFNIATGQTSVTISNTFVKPTSIICCSVASIDVTAKTCIAVAGTNSFVATLNAAATIETCVNFYIIVS